VQYYTANNNDTSGGGDDDGAAGGGLRSPLAKSTLLLLPRPLLRSEVDLKEEDEVNTSSSSFAEKIKANNKVSVSILYIFCLYTGSSNYSHDCI
jgi:hypothetical protein